MMRHDVIGKAEERAIKQFFTGVIGGMLAAIAVQIYLAGMNVDMLVTPTGRSTALAWWLVAGTALIVGYIAAAVTRFLLHRWPLRTLRWIAGAGIVAALAAVGQAAGPSASADAASHVGASLLGGLAMLMAMIGASFGAGN